MKKLFQQKYIKCEVSHRELCVCYIKQDKHQCVCSPVYWPWAQNTQTVKNTAIPVLARSPTHWMMFQELRRTHKGLFLLYVIF